jgi:plastocyanin
MKQVLVLLGIAILLAIAAGCSQPAQSPPAAITTATLPPASTQPMGTATPVLTKTASVSDNTISIGKAFDPLTITVKAGSTVRWVNTDSTEDPTLYNPTHRIQFADKTTSPVLSPSQSWSFIFRSPGVFNYTDIVHTDLQGTVIVE